jgi:hypothetical protein
MNQDYPSPSSLILVAVMNNPNDLEIARVLGWYRIPLKSAPKVISVDYIAFYQTASFGNNKWQIQYTAPVTGHELVKRVDLLKDEPDHPHALFEYYKIQLGGLIQLPDPILADKWRRITFFYTTGEYLANAKSINDLVVHENERKILWQALRERAGRNQDYQTQVQTDLEVDPAIIAAFLGITQAEEIEK